MKRQKLELMLPTWMAKGLIKCSEATQVSVHEAVQTLLSDCFKPDPLTPLTVWRTEELIGRLQEWPVPAEAIDDSVQPAAGERYLPGQLQLPEIDPPEELDP